MITITNIKFFVQYTGSEQSKALHNRDRWGEYIKPRTFVFVLELLIHTTSKKNF